MFNVLAGVKTVHVPYKGAPLALNDLIAGQAPVHHAVPARRDAPREGGQDQGDRNHGREARSIVAGIADGGRVLPGFEITFVVGRCGAGENAPVIVKKLHAEIVKALQTPEVRELLAKQGARRTPSLQPSSAPSSRPNASASRACRPAGRHHARLEFPDAKPCALARLSRTVGPKSHEGAGMNRRSFVKAATSALAAAPLVSRISRSAAAASKFDPGFATASQAVRAIRTGVISARELTEHTYRRIRQHNPKVNAFVTLIEEQAMARAREADEALAAGKVWGPLHGLPIVIKDNFSTAGVRTTSGSKKFENHIPREDSVAVARLEEGRRHHHWQNEPAGVRARQPDP